MGTGLLTVNEPSSFILLPYWDAMTLEVNLYMSTGLRTVFYSDAPKG